VSLNIKESLYRPLRFSEVIGQKIAKKLIVNALLLGRLPRSVILYGPSGTGKTTLARLIAAWFVCERREPNDVCGECTMCVAVQNNSIPDILEFDAASNTSVDDIRQVLDQTNYAPQYSSERIFIIDEAHMLSRNAIAAMLKVLEDASQPAKFIFATTEIEKISDAIRSRCLCIAIKELQQSDVNSYISDVAAKNQIQIDSSAASLIAYLSNGSMREALSILQHVSLLSNFITLTELHSILAFATLEDVQNLFAFLLAGDFVATYDFVAFILNKQVSALQLLRHLIYFVRNNFDKFDKISTLKIMIDLNKLYQDSTKISCYSDMVVIGLTEIAWNQKKSFV
jgi:DNA polymerase-3 subunit gamma/tau